MHSSKQDYTRGDASKGPGQVTLFTAAGSANPDLSAPFPSPRETAARQEQAELAVFQSAGFALPAASGKAELTVYPYDGGTFEVSSAGVYWCKGGGSKRRISDELRIDALTRDTQDRNWGLLLAWRDGDGDRHREQLPMAALHGESAEAAKLLAAGGLRIAPAQHAKLREYLLVCQPEARARSVDKVG